MDSRNRPPETAPLLRIFVGTAALVGFAGIAGAILSLPADAPGLSASVAMHLERSGVEHPVTAVLLNFRGYDTLLELAVLLLALCGVWSLGPAPEESDPPPAPVLDALARWLLPVMLLAAGYLLWVGAYAPGGAFQAGAVLGAAGVLLYLTGRRLPPAACRPLRLLLVLGVAVFSAVGLAVMAGGGALLAYPPAWAGDLILLIETAATLSIGATLAALFLGGRP